MDKRKNPKNLVALIQPVEKMSNPNPGNVYALFLNFIISIFKFQVYVLKLRRRQGKKLSKLMYIVTREVFLIESNQEKRSKESSKLMY